MLDILENGGIAMNIARKVSRIKKLNQCFTYQLVENQYRPSTISWQYFQTKTELSGLTCTLRSYLKVSTRIKKKNEKKIFSIGENPKSDL